MLLIKNNAGLIQICSRSDPFYEFSVWCHWGCADFHSSSLREFGRMACLFPWLLSPLRRLFAAFRWLLSISMLISITSGFLVNYFSAFQKASFSRVTMKSMNLRFVRSMLLSLASRIRPPPFWVVVVCFSVVEVRRLFVGADLHLVRTLDFLVPPGLPLVLFWAVGALPLEHVVRSFLFCLTLQRVELVLAAKGKVMPGFDFFGMSRCSDVGWCWAFEFHLNCSMFAWIVVVVLYVDRSDCVVALPSCSIEVPIVFLRKCRKYWIISASVLPHFAYVIFVRSCQPQLLRSRPVRLLRANDCGRLQDDCGISALRQLDLSCRGRQPVRWSSLEHPAAALALNADSTHYNLTLRTNVKLRQSRRTLDSTSLTTVARPRSNVRVLLKLTIRKVRFFSYRLSDLC